MCILSKRRQFSSYLSTVLVTGFTLASVVGCGTSAQMHTNTIQFQNVTKEQVIHPDAKYDPSVAKGTDYTKVKVLDSSGKTVILDARKHPILFVAYWCPHCQRTLVSLTKNRSQLSQLPILVSLGFPKGVSLKTAVRIEHSEEQQLHLAKFRVYYALSPSAPDTFAPKGYPTMAYENKATGQMMTLFGEHTLSVWQRVLNA